MRLFQIIHAPLGLGEPHLANDLHSTEALLQAAHHDVVALPLNSDLESPQVLLAAQQLGLRIGKLTGSLALLGLGTPGGRDGHGASPATHRRLAVRRGHRAEIILRWAALGGLDEPRNENLAIALDARDLFFEKMNLLEVFAELLEGRDVRRPSGRTTIGAYRRSELRAMGGVLQQRRRERSFECRMTHGAAHRRDDAGRRGDVGEQGRGGRVRVRQEGEQGGGQAFLRIAVGPSAPIGNMCGGQKGCVLQMT